jgi:hypothetical protein
MALTYTDAYAQIKNLDNLFGTYVILNADSPLHRGVSLVGAEA